MVLSSADRLAKRLGNGPFSFRIAYADALPDALSVYSAFLLSYPENADLIPRLPRHRPFICMGRIEDLPDAFAQGATDYLRDPFSAAELEIRVAQVLGIGKSITLTGSSLRLEGTTLFGPAGTRRLNREEAYILQTLLIRAPQPLARSALQRFLWPTLGEDSRVVDSAVSRLRRYIRELHEPRQGPQIRSTRRFGYYLSSL